jgi:hypothetical protein
MVDTDILGIALSPLLEGASMTNPLTWLTGNEDDNAASKVNGSSPKVPLVGTERSHEP